MATMVLKDMLICPECGAEMFPYSFDKESRVIGYRCSAEECCAEKTCGFDQVAVTEGEKINYFVLNDDGEVSWKCHFHGYCVDLIESLLDKDFTKFARSCCIYGREDDEIFEDMECIQGEGRTIVAKILNALDEDQLLELAEERGIDVDEYDGDYLEAFLGSVDFLVDDFRDFIYSLTDTIQYLFDISIDEDGELME
ncbi:MAG: hypothetical protein IJF50_11120 [Peptococcaceae bacterium]|nr:hypothetical protein [Peptococcaceae bacterium]